MRLIDADALKEELGIAEDCDDCERLGAHGCVNSTWAIVCDRIDDQIESAPTIDAVTVVRCKDCKWWTKQEKSIQGRCALTGTYPTGGWYCGNGERRNND